MFLVCKLVFAFAGQNIKFYVNILIICMLYCDAGPGCLIRTVCKYSMLILIKDNIFGILRFSSEKPLLYFGKAIRLSREHFMFLATI